MSTPLATLYVYGDSYSGKVYQGRLAMRTNTILFGTDITNSHRKTNGPVWSQRVAKGWGLQLQSYAMVGSHSCQVTGAPSIGLQMDRYSNTMNRQPSSTKDVHAFFIGVTDIINATSKVSHGIIKGMK
jgi:hypothetical protein